MFAPWDGGFMSDNNYTSERSFHACIVASAHEGRRNDAMLALAQAEVCESGGEACRMCRHCRLAEAMLHPDIIFIDRPIDEKGKKKREIPVGSIRGMASNAWVLPQEAERKVYVIREANRMNVQAQNAALKILEEPPSFARFILGTGSVEELLPTIRSRCAIRLLPGEAARGESLAAEEYLTIAGRGDVPGLCKFFADCESLDSEAVSDMLSGVRRLLTAALSESGSDFGLSRRDAARILELCLRAEEYLRLNVSTKHVLGMLCVLTERGKQID